MFGSEMKVFVLGTKIANNLPIIVSFAIKAVDLIFLDSILHFQTVRYWEVLSAGDKRGERKGLFRKMKTSDFFDGNLRTFEAKPPYFCLKKSDVFIFRNGAWDTNIQDVCFEDDNDAMEVMDAGGKSTGSVESFYR